MDGSVISGYCRQGLKDHESLQMRLEVTDSLFPQPIIKKWSLSGDDMARYGLTLLAHLSDAEDHPEIRIEIIRGEEEEPQDD